MSLVIASLLTKTIYADHAVTGGDTSFCFSPKGFRTNHGVFGMVGPVWETSIIEASIKRCRNGPLDQFGDLRFDWPCVQGKESTASLLAFVDFGKEKGAPIYIATGGAMSIQEPQASTWIFDQYVIIGNMDDYAKGFLDASVQWGKDNEEQMMKALFLLCSRVTKTVSSSFDVLRYESC